MRYEDNFPGWPPGKVIKLRHPDDIRELGPASNLRCDYCKTDYLGDPEKNCRNCGAPVAVAAPVNMWRGIYSSIGV